MKYMNYACAGSILAFSSTLSDSEKEDVISSTLYMQLASNKKHGEFNNFSEWSDTYALLLNRLGYDVSGPHEFAFFSSAVDKGVKIGSVVKATLAHLLSLQEVVYLDQLLRQVSSLEAGSAGLEVLARSVVESRLLKDGVATQTYRVRVQVGIVNDAAELRLVTVNFVTRELIEPNVFNQTFVMSDIVGKIESQYFVAQLGQDYAQTSRAKVLQILGTRREQEIEKLL